MFNIEKIMEAIKQNLNYNELLKINDPFYVQHYVEDMLTKSFSAPYAGKPADAPAAAAEVSSLPEPQVIELHDFIIARIYVPERYDEKNIKVFLSGNQLNIRFDSSKDIAVPLSKSIKKDSLTAIIKNHILEVKMLIDTEVIAEEIDIKFT